MDWSKAYQNTQAAVENFPGTQKVEDLVVSRTDVGAPFAFSIYAKITLEFPSGKLLTTHWTGVVEIKDDCSASMISAGTAGSY